MIHERPILMGAERNFNPSPCRGRIILSQNLFHYVTVDVGEAALNAVVVEGEAFVVNAEEVESGGVEVV